MYSINKVILVGNVGKDPEVRYIENNVPYAKFPLATSEVFKKNNGETVKNTEWHNIVLWRGLAQIAEKYVKKGSQLYLEGKIRSRSWDDKDGQKKYMTEIIGDNLVLLGRKAEVAGTPGTEPPPPTPPNEANSTSLDDEVVSENDLPF